MQTADIAGDGHIVVVEDDDKIEIFSRAVVQRFIDHAVGQGAVSDDRDGIVVIALHLVGLRDTERRGDGGAAVSLGQNIVFAFRAVGEAGNASVLTERVEAFVPTRQELVRVALMADVEDDLILWGMKMAVQRDRRFREAEIRRQMSAVYRYGIYDLFSYF